MTSRFFGPRTYFFLAIALLPAAPRMADAAAADTAAADAATAIGKAPAPFGQNCAVCHGGDAEGTDRAPALLGNRQLRGKSDADVAAIIMNGRGNMPAFAYLPADQLQTLAHFVHSLNADAYDVKPEGDTAAGAALFFGGGHCADCHTAQGRGRHAGPRSVQHWACRDIVRTQSIDGSRRQSSDARIRTGGRHTARRRDAARVRPQPLGA